ncbi:hypothetical protein BaRGS_00005514, partial [Batillaria attramentaria]
MSQDFDGATRFVLSSDCDVQKQRKGERSDGLKRRHCEDTETCEIRTSVPYNRFSWAEVRCAGCKVQLMIPGVKSNFGSADADHKLTS